MSSERHNLIAYIRQVGAKDATRALKSYEASIKGTTQQMSTLGRVSTIAAGILTTQVLRSTVRLATESFKLGAQYDTLRVGFERLTASIDDEVLSLKTLQTATGGMVSQTNLLLSANKSLSLGLPVERMNELFEVATVLGPLMGRTVTDAVNDLAMGIGRQSKMILDNLGIVVSLEEAQTKYAVSLGKTVNELTVAEKKFALFNAVIEEGREVTDLVGDATSKQQKALMKLNATIEDTKVGVGIGLGNALLFLQDTFDANTISSLDFGRSINNLGDAFIDTAIDVSETGRTITMVFDRSISLSEHFGQALRDNLSILGPQTETMVAYYERQEAKINDVADAARAFFEEQATFVTGRKFFVEEEETIAPIQEQLTGLEEVLGNTQSETDLLRLEQLKLTDAFKDGLISEEDYEAAADSLEGKLRDLRIRQSELRIAIDQTTAAMKTQTEALDIGPLGEPTLPGKTFDVPFVTTPEMGSMFAAMKGLGVTTSADKTTNIEITVDVDKLSADPMEIEALVQQMAEALFKEMQKRGGVP